MIKLFTAVFVVTSCAFAQSLPIKPSSANVIPSAVVSTPAQVAARPTQPVASINIRSFKEWKNEKVQMAIKRITITRAQIEYRRLNKQFLQKADQVGVKDLEFERLDATLKNDLYSLEVAQELSVTDYFAIYLTKQENKIEAYRDAAEKMTPDEVSQLIKAYADSMFGSNGATKTGPTAMEKNDKMK